MIEDVCCLVGVIQAITYNGGFARVIWVDCLGHKKVAILVVRVGIAIITALAAAVSVHTAAVDELLLGEADEFASGDEVGTFVGGNRGKGPARATPSLFFDRGDGAGINPVDIRGV